MTWRHWRTLALWGGSWLAALVAAFMITLRAATRYARGQGL